jgi:hypothetical protein
VGNTTPVPAPSGVTTTLPKSSGAVATSKPITVSAGQSYDGGMKNFDRSRESSCHRHQLLDGYTNED